MQVLVTGASGFIGGFLVEELLKRNHRVRCLVLPGEPLTWIEHFPIDVVYGDVRQVETLYPAVEDVESVYHLAGVKTVWDVDTFFHINYEGTKHIFSAVLERSPEIKKFIFVSSQAAAGPSPDGRPLAEDEPCHPVTSYGKSKRAAEVFLQAHSHEVPITILRPSLVYGPRNIETKLLFELIRRGMMPVIRGQPQQLDLIHVRDVVEGILLAGEAHRSSGQIYFITNQDPTTWRELARLSFQLLNRKGWVLPVPRSGIKLAASAVKLSRKVRGQPFSLIDEKMNEILQKYWVCSGRKAEQELGFHPKVSLAEGIADTLRWYEERRQ